MGSFQPGLTLTLTLTLTLGDGLLPTWPYSALVSDDESVTLLAVARY